MEIDLTSIIGIIKIFAIVVALFHLLAGLFITRQITRMNKIVRTQNGTFIFFVAMAYIVLLLIVLLLIITIPV